jgi:hypothetical protein
MALYIQHVPEISMQLMETVKSSHKVLYYIAAGLKDAGRETIKPFSAFLLAAPKQPFLAQPQRMAQSSEFPKKIRGKIQTQPIQPSRSALCIAKV